MSTDLEMRQDLVNEMMRLPSLIIKGGSEVTRQEGEKCKSSTEEEEGCKTPTRSLIPEMKKCPPAPPRKKKRVVVQASCKRKQDDLVLFEMVAREEVEAFFRQIEVVMSKRRFVVLESN